MKRLLATGVSALTLLCASPTFAAINQATSLVTASANGSTTVWSFNFLIPYQADGVTPAATVSVTNNTTHVSTVLDPAVYTVAGTGVAGGGTVTYPLVGSPLPSGYTLTIARSLAYTQPTSVANQSFYPHTVEQVADKLAMQIQQLNTTLNLYGYASLAPGVGYVPANAGGQIFSGPIGVMNTNYVEPVVPGTNPGGCRIMITENQPSTPSVGDDVACTIYINNLDGRSKLWGLDILTFQAVGGAEGSTRSMELEVNNLGAINLDPWSGNPRKNGIELIGHSASTNPLDTAIFTWANDTTGGKWWENGLALSRVLNYGVGCEINPGGATDTGTAFQLGCISDTSNSARVLNVGGSHAIFADLSTATGVGLLFKGFASVDTNFGLWNNSDHDMEISVGSGTSAVKNSILGFADEGTDKWRLIKNTSNDFVVNNFATSLTDISINHTTDLVTISHGLTVVGTTTLPAGSITASNLASGAVVSNIGFTPANAGGQIFSGVVQGTFLRQTLTTVAGLGTVDASPQAGDLAVVSDANACTANATPTGGGAVTCGVMYSGAAWKAVVTH